MKCLSFNTKRSVLLLFTLILAFVLTACQAKRQQKQIVIEEEPEVEVKPAPEPVVREIEEPPPVIPMDPDLPKDDDEDKEEISANITISPSEALNDINFDYNEYILTETARNILTNNANYMLNDNPDINIIVEGHCDERGSNEYNLALGEKRALKTKDYLESLGVPSSRIDWKSYGEEIPLEMGHNEEAWAKNRRAHFNVSN